MKSTSALYRASVLICVLGLSSAALPSLVLAQGTDAANRPVSEVRIEGLKRVPEQLVRNAIRVSPGDAYDDRIVHDDVVRITNLGKFGKVTARWEQLEDGTLVLSYVVKELPLIQDVQVVGIKAMNDFEVLSLVNLRQGDAIEQFLIDRGATQIKKAYEKKGYFLVEVTVDKAQLAESGLLIYHVREGQRVRIRKISFKGNSVFGDRELKSKIQSKTYIPLLRDGSLSRTKLDDDATILRDFYRSRGYRDAQVDRRWQTSPNQKDAQVVFEIDEGRLFTVESIKVEGNEQFSEAQILETMALKVGDVFSQDRMTKSRQNLRDLYGKLGFIETGIAIEPLFDETQPRISLILRIKEGIPTTVGTIEIRGNQLTKSRVILRQARGLTPGRRFDLTGVDVTKLRLSESPLFEKASVTILGDPTDTVRDVLIEVQEKNTGSISFGGGISSDAGVIGEIRLTQRNFDYRDLPESFGELIAGKAFKGAGQYFSMRAQPGSETSHYAMSFREPYVLDSDYFLDTSVFFFERDRFDYDEKRAGGSLGIGQRFGDVWSASVGSRYEAIDITHIDATAPDDVRASGGASLLTSLGVSVTRSTTDRRILPSRGSRLTAAISRVGALGGDYDFTKVHSSYKKYWTIEEDFLGRRTIFSTSVTVGYIFEDDEAPLFERFYAGGHRTLRGFDYRGVGPRGIIVGPPLVQTNDPVGGNWLFLLGFEYNLPIYQKVVRLVLFTDTGTVQDDIGLDEFRMSVGAGLRLAMPFLGYAPFAFDFAVPVAKEPGDETQVFSFDIAVPF